MKHRWSLANNYLTGITASDWWRLLKDNRFAIDPPYLHRAALITVTSCMNSFARRKEQRVFAARVADVKVEKPLFIIGHWRTGTTHLHNLLAKDGDQFAYANTYQVTNPHTFLCTEMINTKRFAWMVPKTRPMDNVALSFEVPQEDEFAPCLMSLRSLYLGVSFPRREEHYARYLTFRDVPREELEEWKTCFLWFLKKLTLKYQRSLVLKSPPHTARIRLLLDMFPEARFVHIHRNPHTVFQSCRRYFETAPWFTYLQRPEVRGIDDRIIRRYNVLYDAFFEERKLIPKERFHELSFEDLERDPIKAMRRLYENLQLPGFDVFKPQLQSYVDSLTGYQKNQFRDLDSATRNKISNAWQRSFDEWRYPA